MKRIGMCIWLLVASLSLGGQTLWPDGTWCVPSGTTPERMLLEERNLWLGSTNPAALGGRPMPDYGTTRLGATSESGAYRRPQQAAEAVSAGFHSDSYLSLKGLHLWGAFDFTQKWHRNRAWADIRDPYNGNPYSAGSAVASRYQEQTVDFHVKASSHRIGRRWWVGAALDYSTGDFSRSSDPRTRTQSLDLAVRPGIAIELSPRSTVGVNGSYRFAKEKMLKPVCKESDNYDKYPYYAFKGMGEYDEPDLLSFSRRFMANYYGGEAKYRYGSGGFSLIVRASATVRRDRVEGQNQASPGDYGETIWSGAIKGLLERPQGLHAFELHYVSKTGRANEFLQESVTVQNPNGSFTSYWRTIFSAVKYRTSRDEAGARWRYYRLDGSNGYRWHVGAELRYGDFENRYVLPASSLAASRAGAELSAGMPLVRGAAHQLRASIAAAYAAVPSRSLTVNTAGKSDLQTGVIDPEYAYFGRALTICGITVDYDFALRKTSGLRGFVAGAFRLIHAGGAGNRCFAGLSLGILTGYGRYPEAR